MSNSKREFLNLGTILIVGLTLARWARHTRSGCSLLSPQVFVEKPEDDGGLCRRRLYKGRRVMRQFTC